MQTIFSLFGTFLIGCHLATNKFHLSPGYMLQQSNFLVIYELKHDEVDCKKKITGQPNAWFSCTVLYVTFFKISVVSQMLNFTRILHISPNFFTLDIWS